MAKKKLDGDALAKLTKDLFHACYRGDLEPWFSYLCGKSVYLGNGDPILVGGDAIRKHFEKLSGNREDSVLRDEYHWMQLTDTACQVYGQLILGIHDDTYYVISRFTLTYQYVGEEIKIVHQQNSYEYMKTGTEGKDQPVELNMDALRLVQNILNQHQKEPKITIKSGSQTMIMDPNMILYVQSNRKHTEIVCADKVIACSQSIGELASIMPDYIFQIHRGYLINAHYVLAFRRFEVELISGAVLPVPEHSYTKVREKLKQFN